MPKMKKGESKKAYVNRCIPLVKKEGKTQKQAVGKCMGMSKSRKKSTKAKR